MNILPKKRWHVRTKDNIARVRRDEAAANEDEQKRLAKLELAESEARINFLRSKSGLPARTTEVSNDPAVPPDASNSNSEHFNLFEDYKSHIKQTNKDLEKEKKEEKEKYEKQIGYLTYLGQDTNESLKLRSWYEVAPKRSEVGELGVIEKDLKNKFTHDPLTLINALLPPEKILQTKRSKVQPSTSSFLETSSKSKELETSSHKSKKSKKEKKHKKDKKHKRDKKGSNKKKKREHKSRITKQNEALQLKKEMLEKLRKERLRREAREKERQEQLLAPVMATHGNNAITKDKTDTTATTPRIVQKYNSQFNPELAKQNMI